MKRLVAYWAKYRPQIDSDALAFLEEKSVLICIEKDVLIKHADRPIPYLFFVLDGLIGGYKSHPEDGETDLLELILPLDFFTGTDHVFTKRNMDLEYRALRPSTLLRIRREDAMHGQQQYPDLSELFLVMRQRKINFLRQSIKIFREKDHYHRYCLYRELMPYGANDLPHSVQQQYLGMSPTHYKRIKANYLRNSKI